MRTWQVLLFHPFVKLLQKKISPGFNPLSILINDASPQGNISKLHFPCLKKQSQNTPQHGLRTPLELPLKGEHLTFQVTTLEKHA